MRSGWVIGVAWCALLAGCGGEGSDTPAVSVVPGGSMPTPTGTVTPASSASVPTTGEVKPDAGATFIAATLEMTTTSSGVSALTGRTTGGSTANRAVTLDTPGFAASYAVATGYRLADATASIAFGPSEFTSDTTASDRNFPTVSYARASSQGQDYLALYRPSVTTSSSLGSGTLTPGLGGTGGWQHSVSDGGGQRTRLTYFAYGTPTPVGSMPRSGVVKYSVLGSGNYAGDGDLYFTSGLNTITVDFGAGTIFSAYGASGYNFFTSGYGGLYGVRLRGTIAGNAVSGATESDVAVASGRFRLFFVGPAAEELVLLVVGQDGRGTYLASSVGIRNPYLN